MFWVCAFQSDWDKMNWWNRTTFILDLRIEGNRTVQLKKTRVPRVCFCRDFVSLFLSQLNFRFERFDKWTLCMGLCKTKNWSRRVPKLEYSSTWNCISLNPQYFTTNQPTNKISRNRFSIVCDVRVCIYIGCYWVAMKSSPFVCYFDDGEDGDIQTTKTNREESRHLTYATNCTECASSRQMVWCKSSSID